MLVGQVVVKRPKSGSWWVSLLPAPTIVAVLLKFLIVLVSVGCNKTTTNVEIPPYDIYLPKDYRDKGHDSWTETYNNPEFYQWLAKQKRTN